MYGELKQWTHVQVPPEDLGPSFKNLLREHVRARFENKFSHDGDYCVAVDEQSVELLENPVVQDGTCLNLCKVEFNSIVCRPFVGETVYVRIHKLHEVGVIADSGPVRIFVSTVQMPHWKYFSATTHTSERYVHDHDGGEMRTGTYICVKFIGVRKQESNEHKFHCLGTMNGPDLGPIRKAKERTWHDAAHGSLREPENSITGHLPHTHSGFHSTGGNYSGNYGGGTTGASDFRATGNDSQNARNLAPGLNEYINRERTPGESDAFGAMTGEELLGDGMYNTDNRYATGGDGGTQNGAMSAVDGLTAENRELYDNFLGDYERQQERRNRRG
mmetsp:Transcript_18894/g.47210  ORF Transcript_18894/g.47210 Transcript_18894/m.47210 type:complete len:331 (-) Transcript_18894:229-1221(-)|eukprot:CAMPEP_0179000098 /NCGR_PEP_ID=MMETSP0795-20121207/10467_1 /TAXON_ID=88552 /ORGANISM="Amoebophrya sp., Strain Ameob2" /LENGTH=330 /DNA_ID=CAMNT_0020693025 /DNA_START=500 /DNA_END=1492 /DNA_ORIENTATION=-